MLLHRKPSCTLVVPAEDSTGTGAHNYQPSEQTWLPNKHICALSLLRLIPVFPLSACRAFHSFVLLGPGASWLKLDWGRASFTASEREERLLHASLDLFSLANFPPLLAVPYTSGPFRVPWRLSLFRSAFLSNAILSHRCPWTLQSTPFPLQTITARPHPILQFEFACMGCDLALVQWGRLQQLGDKICIW